MQTRCHSCRRELECGHESQCVYGAHHYKETANMDPVSEPQPATPNGEQTPQQPTEKPQLTASALTKKQLVALALSNGITSPTAISEWMRTAHGVAIPKAHVSALKTDLRREQQTGKPRRHVAVRKQASVPIAPKATSTKPGLSVADLTLLTTLVRKAGGVERLSGLLETCKGLR